MSVFEWIYLGSVFLVGVRLLTKLHSKVPQVLPPEAQLIPPAAFDVIMGVTMVFLMITPLLNTLGALSTIARVLGIKNKAKKS